MRRRPGLIRSLLRKLDVPVEFDSLVRESFDSELLDALARSV